MSESNSGDDKTVGGSKKTLTLRPGGSGMVRQNLSRGRSNAVVVETKKRRITKPGETPKPAPAPAPEAVPAAVTPKPAEPVAEPKDSRPSLVLKELSASEVEARSKALEEAKVRAVEDEKRDAEEALRRQEADKKAEAARIAAEKEDKETAELTAKQAEAAAEAEAEAARNAAADASKALEAAEDGGVRKPTSKEAPSTLREVRRPKTEEARPTAKPKGGDPRRRAKLTLSNALNEGSRRGPSMAALRRRREKEKRAQNAGPREKVMREVTVPDTISIQELAQRMTERSVDVVKLLMQQGQMLKPGDIIEGDMAQLIAEEMGHTVKRVSESDIEVDHATFVDDDADITARPPCVTIMGHVDHGKTSLLDALRETNIVKGEAGGITQHIGAYQVDRDGRKITFLDTPGHEAFTAMRARGAAATDIAILVVAADDGVMPQTIESIKHAKAAEVPIIVAINKTDKPDSDANKVRSELLQHEVFVESMGGEILDVEVSALKGTNLDKLLDAILLQTELLELNANPKRPAQGIVIEAQLDKGRGAVATVLVQNGTLKVGDIVVAGSEWGRVRALINDRGEQQKEAPPSLPVELLGLAGAPSAGDELVVVESEARAREISDYRQRVARELAVAKAAGSRGSLEQMMTKLQTGGAKDVPLVVKADVQGSVEAITQALEGLNTDEVEARVVHGAAGGITESDVTLAAASGTPIIGFNVRANKQARELASKEGIEIRYYNVIYDLVDDVKKTMSGLLEPERRETFLGNAEILEVFDVSKIGKVAGCLITEGKVERGAGVRLIRDDVVIHEGELSTLKRFKDEVSEVASGTECGMGFERYQDIRKGDVIECFRVEHIARSL